MTKATQEISLKIKQLRLTKGLSQAAIGVAAGVDRKTINRIENNHFSPSMETFFRICVALDVRPSEIVKGIKV